MGKLLGKPLHRFAIGIAMDLPLLWSQPSSLVNIRNRVD